MAGKGSLTVTDLRNSLKNRVGLKVIDQNPKQTKEYPTKYPLCYLDVATEKCLVISPGQESNASGNLTPPTHLTSQIFNDIANSETPLPQDINKIIIPIALTSRKHWVTVSYDKEKNVATIIDPRPWYVSFFWPNGGLKKVITEGLINIGMANKENPIKFSNVYQGVQHNDVTCGQWALANVFAQLLGKTTDEMRHVFSSRDEGKIVDTFSVGIPAHNKYKPTIFTQLLQGFLNLFRLSGASNEKLISDIQGQQAQLESMGGFSYGNMLNSLENATDVAPGALTRPPHNDAGFSIVGELSPKIDAEVGEAGHEEDPPRSLRAP